MNGFQNDTTVTEATKQIEDWWRKTWRGRVIRFGGICLFLFVGWFLWQTNKPLYTVESVTITPQIVPAGGSVMIHYALSLNKRCARREITKYLVEVEDGMRSYVIGRHMGTIGEGPTDMISMVSLTPIPADIPPGKYRYQFVVHALCSPIGHSANFIYEDGYVTVR